MGTQIDVGTILTLEEASFQRVDAGAILTLEEASFGQIDVGAVLLLIEATPPPAGAIGMQPAQIIG